MKFIYSLLAFILILSSCKNEDFVRIDSLSHLGESCFQGQKVPVWVSVETGDKANTEYEWSCTGGEFEEIPGGIDSKLYHTIWIAPMEKGTYQINCTVKCGGESETRTTEIKVDKYLFYDFNYLNQYLYFTKTKATATINASSLDLLLKGTAKNAYGYISTFVDDTPVKPSLTLEMDLKTGGTYGNQQAATYLDYVFARPEAENKLVDKYIRNLRIEIYPRLNVNTNKKDLIPSVVYDDITSLKDLKHNVFVWCEEYDARFDMSEWKLISSEYIDGLYLSTNKIMRHVVSNLDVFNNTLNFAVDDENINIPLNNVFLNSAENVLVDNINIGVYHTNCQIVLDNLSVDLND